MALESVFICSLAVIRFWAPHNFSPIAASLLSTRVRILTFYGIGAVKRLVKGSFRLTEGEFGITEAHNLCGVDPSKSSIYEGFRKRRHITVCAT